MTFPRQRHAGTRHIFRTFLSQNVVSSRTAEATAVPKANAVPRTELTATLTSIGTLNGSRKASRLRLTVTGLALLGASLGTLNVAHVATAKAKKSSSSTQKLPGAPAWTKGSQTYLRAGYSTDTPVVAKVARGTQVFVWGKYNGWYRVETSDHKFAWVHHDLLNCPKSDKVAYLSPAKARIASARSANQRLYGASSEVSAHKAKYGVGPAANTARIAKAPAQKPAAQKSATQIAARAKIVTPKANPSAAPRVVTPRPVVGSAAAEPAVISVQQVRWERDEVALSPSRPSRTTVVKGSPGERPLFATERKEGTVAPAASIPAVSIPAVSTPDAPTSVAPIVVTPDAPVSNTPVGVTRVDSAPVVRAPIATKATPVKAAPPKAVKAPAKKAPAKKAPSKVAAKAPATKLSAAQIRARKRQEAETARRNTLRARLGTPPMAPPPVASDGVRPISPAELLRAREAFLARQRKSQARNSGNPENIEPTAFDSNAPHSARITPMLQRSAFDFQTPVVQEIDSENSAHSSSVEKLAPLIAAADGNAAQWTALAQKSAKKTAQKATPNRGGSPRDFANGRGPAGKQKLGEAMANQALTYRGTPYRYGASSPSSGFDCSGLIYYILRQRGYNPPRTAAGLAKYGKPVKRNELKSGDIVLFSNTYKRGVSHVGIYVGNNNFVHAPNTGSRVRVDSLDSSYYSKKYYSARRAS